MGDSATIVVHEHRLDVSEHPRSNGWQVRNFGLEAGWSMVLLKFIANHSTHYHVSWQIASFSMEDLHSHVGRHKLSQSRSDMRVYYWHHESQPKWVRSYLCLRLYEVYNLCFQLLRDAKYL